MPNVDQSLWQELDRCDVPVQLSCAVPKCACSRSPSHTLHLFCGYPQSASGLISTCPRAWLVLLHSVRKISSFSKPVGDGTWSHENMVPHKLAEASNNLWTTTFSRQMVSISCSCLHAFAWEVWPSSSTKHNPASRASARCIRFGFRHLQPTSQQEVRTCSCGARAERELEMRLTLQILHLSFPKMSWHSIVSKLQWVILNRDGHRAGLCARVRKPSIFLQFGPFVCAPFREALLLRKSNTPTST